MFCKKCGSTLRDNAKFCGSCGAVVEVADAQGNNFSYTAPVQQNAPSYTAPVQQNSDGHTVPVKKTGSFAKKAGATKVTMPGFLNKIPQKLLPVIGIAAVVVLVLILVVSGVFTSDSGRVAKAFAKSVDAYVNVANDLKLPDLAAIGESGKYNQELRLWIEDGGDELDGAGVRVSFAYNQSGEEATIVAAPFFEDTDLITAQMKLKGSKIYFGCPELMEDTYLMVDTMTIGEDLADKDVDGMEDLSFNLFTLIGQLQEASTLPKDQQKALEKAASTLVKAIEVEKDGKDEIKVNGEKLSCTVYNVVIPQDAMEEYLDAMEDAIKDMDPEAAMDIMEEAGFPMDEMGISMDNDDMLTIIDELKDAVDELGDIEAQVAINGGYVVAVLSEFSLYGSDYELTLHLGGGDNYVDDLSLEVIDEDEYGFVITSSGNHAMQKGVFTDETTVTSLYGGSEYDEVISELSWEPKGKEDNFEWNLEVGSDEIVMEGTVTCSKDTLNLNLTNVEFDGGALGVSYTLGGYKAASIKMGETLAFAEMDEGDMEDLVELIDENGSEWGEMMQDDYGDLINYISNMLYYW